MPTPEFVLKRLKLVSLGVAVLMGVAAVLYLTPVSRSLDGSLFNKLWFIIAPLIASIVGFKRSKETTGGVSTAFSMGGGAMLANAGFGVLAGFFPHLTDPRHLPIIDTVFILGVYVPGVCAALWATAERKSLTYILDGLLASASFLFIAWNAFVSEVLRQFTGDMTATLVALSSPMFDAAMVTMALLAARRGTQIFSRGSMLGLAAAEVFDGVNDLAWAYHGMHTPMPSICMFFWTAHTMMLMIAFLMPAKNNNVNERPPSIPYLLFPYLPPLIAGVAAIRVVVKHESISTGTAILGAVVLVSLLSRQLIAVLEHARMGQRLEKTIDALRARELELEHLSMHDPLTALPNRRYLTQRVEDSNNRDAEFVVLLLDLNDFKEVNDTLGHDAGDALLVYVADILRANIRNNDTVARLGGDEFAVLLERTNVDIARPIAERIVSELEKTFHIAGCPVKIGSSVGLACGVGLDNFDDIMRDADMAMYERKRSENKGGLTVFIG